MTLNYINTEENLYKLSIDLKASGNAADNVVVAESQYADELSSNGAIVGKTISITYDNGKINEGTLKFNDDFINETKEASNGELQGLKKYYVFNYNEKYGILVPVPITYDEAQHQLSAQMIGTGNYCVMNLQTWFSELGVEAKTESNKTNSLVSTSLYRSSNKSMKAVVNLDNNAVDKKGLVKILFCRNTTSINTF